MANRGRVVLLVLAGVSVAAGIVGGCSTFGGDDSADAGVDATSDAPVVDDVVTGDAPPPDADAGADSSVCEPEPAWAEPDGSVGQYASCGVQSGVDLLGSPNHCGRCGHTCVPASCVNGRCVERIDSPESSDVSALGEIGDDLFFTDGLYRLKALSSDGGARLVQDWAGLLPAGEEFRYIFGGVAGVPGDSYIRTRALLFRWNGAALSPVAALPDNDRPEYLALTPSGVFVSSKDDIYRVAPGADAATVVSAAPKSVYVASHANAVYWLEQPWSERAGGDPDASTGDTLLKRIESGTTALVHSEPGRLTALVSRSDGLYYMRIGAGGGIFRLPHDATPATVPVLVAADDGLDDKRPYIATDETYVYWTHPDVDYDVAEIWKRAKCGGANIRLGRVFLMRGLVSRGDRPYYGSNDELHSLSK